MTVTQGGTWTHDLANDLPALTNWATESPGNSVAEVVQLQFQPDGILCIVAEGGTFLSISQYLLWSSMVCMKADRSRTKTSAWLHSIHQVSCSTEPLHCELAAFVTILRQLLLHVPPNWLTVTIDILFRTTGLLKLYSTLSFIERCFIHAKFYAAFYWKVF